VKFMPKAAPGVRFDESSFVSPFSSTLPKWNSASARWRARGADTVTRLRSLFERLFRSFHTGWPNGMSPITALEHLIEDTDHPPN
jgi:hypothetical protein